MGEPDFAVPAFLDRVVDFPGSASYELLQPLTDLRSCHYGTPAEARILFRCRRLGHSEGTFVMKVKVQEPKPGQVAEQGPSTTTIAELDALERLSKAKNPYTPQLVAWKRAVQGDNTPLPGGFLTFTVMTEVPGDTLYDLRFWEMLPDDRAEIVQKFLPALRSVFAAGIEPNDRGLRNILWSRKTKQCSIIDFELWSETTEVFADETRELQRWGLARRPPPRSWLDAWNWERAGASYGSSAKINMV